MGSETVIDVREKIAEMRKSGDFRGAVDLLIRETTDEQKAENQAELAKRRESELRDLRIALLDASGLSRGARSKTLESYDPRHPSQSQAYTIAGKFIDRLPNVARGLMIHGATGTGKSHLLKAIVQAVTQKEQPIKAFYVDCFALQRQLKADPDLQERMLRCRLLALDDIEKGLGGDAAPWVRALLKSVIDAADSEGNPVLLSTSEFSLDEHKTYGNLPDYLVGRLGKLMHWQHIEGPNGREIEAAESAPWWK